MFAGVLVARATEGGQRVRTSFAVRRESEAYDLTLKYVDTEGRPSQSGTLVLGQNVDLHLDQYDTDGDGVVKTRVPKGTYLLETLVRTPKGAQADPDLALMAQPKLTVSKNTTVTFDARKAKPVDITVPGSAKSVQTFVKYSLESDSFFHNSVWQSDSFKGFRTGHVGGTLPAKELSSQVAGIWQNGSTTYNLVYDRGGSLHTGLTRKVATSELALVKLGIGASVTAIVRAAMMSASVHGPNRRRKPKVLPSADPPLRACTMASSITFTPAAPKPRSPGLSFSEVHFSRPPAWAVQLTSATPSFTFAFLASRGKFCAMRCWVGARRHSSPACFRSGRPPGVDCAWAAPAASIAAAKASVTNCFMARSPNNEAHDALEGQIPVSQTQFQRH